MSLSKRPKTGPPVQGYEAEATRSNRGYHSRPGGRRQAPSGRPDPAGSVQGRQRTGAPRPSCLTDRDVPRGTNRTCRKAPRGRYGTRVRTRRLPRPRSAGSPSTGDMSSRDASARQGPGPCRTSRTTGRQGSAPWADAAPRSLRSPVGWRHRLPPSGLARYARNRGPARPDLRWHQAAPPMPHGWSRKWPRYRGRD